MLQFFVNMFTMRRHENERGASAVEYGLLVAGIAALIVLVVFTLGGTVKSKFTNTNNCITSSGSSSGC
jgi:pilus assembly protein Flp/PilA